MPRQEMMCTRCLTVAAPKKQVRGSFVMELAAWCLLLIPGIIYSFWRLTTKQLVCPACGSAELIPPSSPRATELLSARPR